MTSGRTDIRVVPPASQNDTAILRTCLYHAMSSATLARFLTENFSATDFRTKEDGDLAEALRHSLSVTGGIDDPVVAEVVGWEALIDFKTKTEPLFDSVCTFEAIMDLVRKRTQTEAIVSIRNGDYSKAEQIIRDLNTRCEASGAVPGRITATMVEAFQRSMTENSTREHLGFKTGIPQLDKLTLGLPPGWTWGIGGATSSGKTQLAAQIANEVILQGGVVLYVSLEMASPWILSRLLGANLGINPTRIYMGHVSQEVRAKAEGVLTLFGELHLYVRDDITELGKIVKAAHEVRSRVGRLDLLVVDFIQLAQVRGINQQIERMATASTRMQALARETGACVLVLSQLSNDAVREKGKGALTFRYASELAHASDVALELVPETNGTTSMVVKKNRAGQIGQFRMTWGGDYSRFEKAAQ